MIRLIALDVDGTLLDSEGHIPDGNRVAIARAIEQGVEVVLATGRRFDFLRPVFESLPAPLTLILSNGAIVKTTDGRTLVRTLLPRDAARDVLAGTRDYRDRAALIFDRVREGQVVYERVNWDDPRHSRYFHANRPFITETDPLEDALTEDPVQVMFTGPCAAMRGLHERLRRAGGWSVALTEYLHRDFSLVDVTREGCTKGAALAAWVERRGLSRDQVMAVGDNLNDLEMLEFAGRPVVMGNGAADLKARGWAQTASNDAGGVATAIETYVLRRAS